jgi:uncharacterized protein YndB with AHSA1/START domain
MKWNNASDDWHTPAAKNDLRVGGSFTYTMAAKDGSASFDFCGAYSEVREHELITYAIEDGRKVRVEFNREGNRTHVVESFEAETENSVALQRQCWQAILDNFKRYTESNH